MHCPLAVNFVTRAAQNRRTATQLKYKLRQQHALIGT
jgi:hypothetical protein